MGWAVAALVATLYVASALHAAPQGANQNPGNTRAEHGREFLGLAAAPDRAAAAQGQKLFVQNCGFCHGNNATGAEGPDLLRSTLVLHDEKGELIGPFLHKGRPEKGMPPFPGFTDEQSYELAEFLHARVEEAANRFGYKIQNVVTGNAAAGEEYFKTKGRCSECHSPAKDLAHIGSKFDPAELQAQFLYPSESPPIQVTVVLHSGESVSGNLKRLDDFTVSMYDRGGEYHSWPREQVKIEVHDPLAAHRELLDRYSDQDMHNLLAYLATLK